MVYIFLSSFVLLVCSDVDDFNKRNLFLTAKLLKQGYRYHKSRKAFSKFYHRQSELIVSKLHWVKNYSATRHIRTYIYGDLVYKLKRIVGKSNFSDQFKKSVIILMGKRKLVALLVLSSWCLMMVRWLFLADHGVVCCL